MKSIEIDGKSYLVLEESERYEASTRTGKTKYWVGYALKRGNDCFTASEFWQDENGKRRFSAPYPAEPKNVGKANETDAVEQAILEYNSMVSKQMDKGYLPEGSVGKRSNKRALPMLAQKFKDRKHYVEWPAYVQPKLDGMRMLFNGKEAWSRKGKDIPFECIEHLYFETQGYTVDGELILDGNPLLQVTLGAAKAFDAELSPRLTYQVYDIVEPDIDFRTRFSILKNLVADAPKNVRLVPTLFVESEDEVMREHDRFVAEGYEGAIVRNMSGKYQVGFRSNDLLKVKAFLDEEFEITGVVEGVAGEKGQAAKLECKAKNGKLFYPRPKGTVDYRRELWLDRRSLIGKEVTVRYRNLSLDGIPVFPIATVIRDYE